MALRLRGSTSGYAEIDAPAVAGDVTLTLPSTTGTINVKDASGNTEVGTGVTFGNPSANIFTINNTGGERLRIAADGTVSIPGALNVSGVLTYEDVTSVDAIGLSTFRDGLNTKDVGITTISTSIVGTGTTVDVFIYDTSKDSDGGEWRKRTSHTSWYNETLNTATRGSRKEFPAVAVIVAETDKVTIYDGDDPDLPMWMVFNESSSASAFNLLGYSARTSTAVAALNAEFMFCSTGNQNQTYFNLISDYGFLIYDGGSTVDYYNGNIGQRNDGLHYRGQSVSRVSGGIVNRNVNDVAMTVLPNAPIDPATGLPIPTIAVGTDSVLSVIKDDGTVVDYTGFGPIDKTEINSNYVYSSVHTSGNDYVFKSSFLSADSAYTTKIIAGSGGFYANSINSIPKLKNMTVTDVAISSKDNTLIRSGNDGIEIFDGNVTTINSTQSITPFAYISKDYNTGYMVGDIKGAFLSDTTVETFSPTNLVTEDFSANWTEASGGTHSVSSGQLTITNGGTNGRAQSNTFATTSGKKYAFIVKTVSNSSASYRLEVRGPETVTQGTTDGQTLVSYFNGTGNSSTYVELYAIGTSGSSATYEDAYVVEIEEDRSVNNKGLQVYGTITKSPVAGSGATAAELVGYSGFSNSDYLEQPYNSDLDFGTGDFSITCWFKPTGSVAIADTLFYRGIEAETGGRILLAYLPSGDSAGLAFYANSGTWGNQATTSGVLATDVWHHIVAQRKDNVLQVYLNGIIGSTPQNNSENLTNTSAVTRIGYRTSTSSQFAVGHLSLLRVSASAPSAEQIKKMYEDEKVLFQENAKATLYGSSDAVTALAYDEVTDQLHVGTSSGRSDFQGLHRINNTTTAVTTAISAHDSFILEE